MLYSHTQTYGDQMRKLDLVGQKFTRMLVIASATPEKGRTQWVCRCDCGIVKTIPASKLTGGRIKSCGCLNMEKRIERCPQMTAVNTKYTPKEASARVIWKYRYNQELSFDDFFRLSQMDCHYCGAKPSNLCNWAKNDKRSSQSSKDNADFVYNGLDRLNCSGTHTIDNVVPCCWPCNYTRHDRSVDEFLAHCERIYFHQQKKKQVITAA